jgi:hypothetical protein
VEAGQGGGGLGVGGERDPAAHRLVEDHAEGVHVGPAVDAETLDLLGGEVLGRPQHLATGGQVGPLGRLGDAEVGDDHATGGRQQHVGRLDVAVDDAGPVGDDQGLGDAGPDPGRLGLVERAPVEELAERLAVDQLHDDGLESGGRAGVVDRDDRGMGQAGRGEGLGAEPGDERGVLDQVLEQDLHRHGAVEDLVAGLPDAGHAPCGEGVVEAVAPGEEVPRPCGAGRADRRRRGAHGRRP